MPDPVGQGSLPFLYNDFHGGLNTKDAVYLLTDNQARDLSNVQGTTAGSIVKRTGLVTLATPANTPTSLFASEATASTFLIATGGTAIYSITYGTPGTVTTITGASGPFTSGARWEFVSAPQDTSSGTQGPVYGLNGTDHPQQWTGTGNTADWSSTDAGTVVGAGPTGVPNGKYCIYANNQVFIGGVASFPSRVYWSGIAGPCQWNPANLNGSGYMDFDPNDGQAITGLGRVGPYVLVTKPRKLFILVDPATATVRRLSDNVGCVSHRSIATGPEGTYFLSEDRGVYVTNGSKLTPISDSIQPTLDSIAGNLRGQAAAAYVGGHYYLSASLMGGNNDTTLDFDATLDSWWKHTVPSNQFAIWHPLGYAQLYSAKASAAFVDLWPQHTDSLAVYVDNGTPFTWTWYGPWQSPTFYRRRRFPTPYFRKRLRQVRLDGFGTVDVGLAKDFAGGATMVAHDVFNAALTSGTFGGSGNYAAPDGTLFGAPGVGRKKLFTLGVANAFSLVFSATSTTPDELISYVLMMTDRRDLVNS